MSRSIILVLLALFALFHTGYSIKCYQCDEKFCAQNHTHIQEPCPHFNNVCYTLRNPKTHKVVKKACGKPDFCQIYVECKSCKADLCNIDF